MRKRHFKHGDSVDKALDSDWLNEIERRLSKFENITVGDSLSLQVSQAGIAIGFEERVDNFELVQLDGDLSANGTQSANTLHLDSAGTTSEDTTLPLTVRDIFAQASDDDAKGLALKHPNSEAGEYVFFPVGGGSTIQWGRTQTNWESNSGDWRVPCKAITDTPKRTGTNTTGANFYVYLPGAIDKHPNVLAGVNLSYLVDDDNYNMCVSNYLDAKIGTVVCWAESSGSIPLGWGIMNGSDNSVGNGGSGIIMANGADRFFARAAANDGQVGDTGGTNTHNHIAHDLSSLNPHDGFTTGLGGNHTHTVTGGAHYHKIINSGMHDHTITAQGSHTHTVDSDKADIADHTGNTNTATVPIDNHNLSSHSHTLTDGETNFADGEDGIPANTTVGTGDTDLGILVHTNTSHVHGLGSLTHTANGHTHPLSGPGTHDHTITDQGNHNHTTETDGAHVHTVNTVADHDHSIPTMYHSGTLSHSDENHIPPYKGLYFIERLDNSL